MLRVVIMPSKRPRSKNSMRAPISTLSFFLSITITITDAIPFSLREARCALHYIYYIVCEILGLAGYIDEDLKTNAEKCSMYAL